MATYQTRGRGPLLDRETQAVLERRSLELGGLLLAALGVAAGLMLWSYSPDDPNWMLASDAPVHNWLGRLGASVAHPLTMIVGRAAWVVPLVLLAWGLRLPLHLGEERLGRLVFAPLAVALAALYGATLAPPAGWAPRFGLGGLFGDTVLGFALTVLPLGAGFAVKVMSLALALAVLVSVAWVAGVTRDEARGALRFLILGAGWGYEMILRGLGRGMRASAQVARGAQARAVGMRAARRERAVALEDELPPPRRQAAVVRAPEPAVAPREAAMRAPLMPPPVSASGLAAPPRRAMPPAPSGIGALLSRVPGIFTRPAERPEPPSARRDDYIDEDIDTLPVDDRIRARIGDAIRARARAGQVVTPQAVGEMTAGAIGGSVASAIARLRGPRPLILGAQAPQSPRPHLDEPPLTGPAAPAADPVIDDDDAEVWENPVETPAFANSPAAPAAPRVVQAMNRRPIQPSTRARAEAQPVLPLEDRYAGYEFPPLALLADPAGVPHHTLSDEALEENARMLESVLDDYGVRGEIVSVRPGPVVTMYELEPAPGLKASRVIGLADDIARSMSALSARVSTVPGRSVIGIELPNERREKVVLREILAARQFGDSQMRLPLALGKDIGGEPVVANLAKMPHLLIAGTTGSGKSVAINTMILSLLYKLTPEECRLIMIDPKMLELSVYDGIPHLLSPVVTDPKKAVVALKWVVAEMEDRYRKMSKMGVRNIEGYNGRVREALGAGEVFSRTVQTGFDEETGDPVFETEEILPEPFPYIVVVVDEMADLMMVAGKEIEACIQRLAQMARASGIHLIMATQRPSVDVITGTIKANFPTRISFQVTSKIDSRTILGEQGAEQLLGMGDMLYMAGGGRIQRVHGPFCSDEEVEEVVAFLKAWGPPDYQSGVTDGPDDEVATDIDAVLGLSSGAEGDDALYDMAVQIVARDRKCSTSYIQRKLAIGYNKAARLVEQMEDQGVVSAANAVGKREILVPEVQ
ncbi:MAG: DNA translocase FtsK [Rubellimicrobium sp.]|nr:DNA translocase FtsK [Rubellimicrobium sp.]